MAAPQSQHRCVFVGNIPYDATEEQLKEICEEVGPVVSFRLVVDRETGKPKGYGFCEYKDDETAASARRNLSGYEINGRQLRVDFAENGKNVADKNREQGRGGPGMASTADHQKQFGALAVLGDATLHQHLGVSVAVAGAALMAQILGGVQNVGMPNHLGMPSQQVLGSDPLTLHLARMSKNQLSEIISEIKDMATQNKEQARQVLIAYPNLTKALFQAQIMLGIVPAEVLQMPNIQQISAQSLQPVLRDGVQAQVSAFQTLPGLLSVPQNRGQYNSLSVQETSAPVGHSVSVLPNQPAALSQFSVQPQIQLPQLVQNKILHLGQLSGQSLATLPSIRPQPQGNLSFRPHQVANSSVLKQTIQPSLLQDQLQVTTSTSSTHVQPFQSARSQIPDQNVQHNSSLPGVADIFSKDPRRQVSNSRINATLDPRNHPSKLVRLNDGKHVPSSVMTTDMETLTAGPSQNFSTAANQVSGVDKTLVSEKQASQMELPPEVDSALLQQVLQLTPEQLSSLPPDQQQQVRQLQEMLRQSTPLRN